MPNFAYRARSADGKTEEGLREAPSQDDLIAGLQKEGLLVLSVSESKRAPGAGISAGKSALSALRRRMHSGVSINDLLNFCKQLSTLLNAGVTLLKSIETIGMQVESRQLYFALEAVKEDLRAGSTLKAALAKHPRVFSRFWVSMIESGEASGNLPLVLGRLGEFLETSSTLRKKIISAMTYPIILVCMAVAALIIFTIVVIPVFEKIFAGFNVKLPPLTRLVIAISFTVRHYIVFVAAGIVAVVFLFKKYTQTEQGRWQFDQFKMRLPIAGPLVKMIALERFASSLATLLSSGIPILNALDITSRTVGNAPLERAIGEVKERVRDGKSMTELLAQNQLFPVMMVQMVGVGEEAGDLSKMLERVSAFYKEQLLTSVERLSAAVEPLMLVLMGGVIGVLVISMFMPIFEIATAVK